MWLIKSGKIHNLNSNAKTEILKWLYLVQEKTLEECAQIFEVGANDLKIYLENIGVFGKKFCKKCGQLKTFDEFYKAYNKTNGSCTQSVCIDCWTDRNKEYFQENKQNLMIKMKQYKCDNFDKWIKTRRKWERNKYNTDILFKLKKNMGTLTYLALRQNKSRESWENIVGYTVEVLKQHLESQFDDKMTWNNYGSYWQIDHIVPIAAFNFTSYEDEAFKKCWSLQNLRPLHSLDNSSKGDVISEEWGNVELAKELL